MRELPTHRRILELAEQGGLPSKLGDSSEIDIAIFRELHDSGYLSAKEVTSFSGVGYLEPRITMTGRQLLDEMRAEEKTTPRGKVFAAAGWGLWKWIAGIIAAVIAGLIIWRLTGQI